MKGITSEGAPQTAGLVVGFIVIFIVIVILVIKCINWAPALLRKAQTLPRGTSVLLRKRNRSDPPEEAVGA